MKALLLFITIFTYLAMNNSLMAGTETKDAESYLKNSKTFFIENKGQIKDTEGNVRHDIKYYIKGNGMDIYFRDEGISYVMYKKTELENGDVNAQTQRVDLEFGDGIHKFKIVPYDENITKINMMKGEINVKNARTFSKLVYENVAEGIDLVYYPTPKSIKYDFVVKPNADLSKLNIKYNGVNSLEKIDNTSFKISTDLGDIVEEVPSTYQMIDNKKLEYTADILINDNSLQFDVGSYDKNYELVIDPELYWSTYIGDGGIELVGRYPSNIYNPNLTAGVPSGYASGGIDVDDEDNVYIVGSTNSNNFPWDTGQGNSTSDWDIFIQKYEEDGTLVYSDYVGGSGNDFGLDLELDEDFDPIICGATNSSNIFTSGRSYNAGYDYYIYEHKTIPQAACYGGTGDDFARGLTLSRDLSGNTGIIVTVGETMSSNAYTYNAWDATLNGSSDVYIVALYSTFTTKWTRYLGGDGDEIGMDVAFNKYKIPIDEDVNELIIIGATDDTTNFPFTVTYPYQNVLNRDATVTNEQDGFIMDLIVSNGRDRTGTLYGGKDRDFLTDIEYIDEDIFLISGYTESDQTTDLFPWIPTGAFKSYDFGGINDKGDGFIAAFAYDTNFVMLHNGYIGGKDLDIVTDIEYDNNLNLIYATGYTLSDNFDIHHEFQTNMNLGASTDSIDAFQATFSYNLDNIYSTYFGSGDRDYGLATTFNSHNRPIIYGESYAYSDFYGGPLYPIPLLNQAQTSYGGGDNDAFLTTFYSEIDVQNVRWSTFFGGDDTDSIYAMSVDKHDFVYITGTTKSDTLTESFPVTLGLVSDSLEGTADIFVTKFNRYGKRLWTTYLGGSGDDAALDMDVLNTQHWDDVKVYLTGFTSSSDFRSQASSYGEHSFHEGEYDAFVARLSSDGSDLEVLTFLGSKSLNVDGTPNYRDEDGRSIDIDQSTGNIYTCGRLNAVYHSGGNNPYSSWFDTTSGKWNNNSFYNSGPISSLVGYVAKWDEDLDLIWGRWLGSYGSYVSDVEYNETNDRLLFCGNGNNNILPDTITNNNYYHRGPSGTTSNNYQAWLMVLDNDTIPYYGTYLTGINSNDQDSSGYVDWNEAEDIFYYAGTTENDNFYTHWSMIGSDKAVSSPKNYDLILFSFNDNITKRYIPTKVTLLGDEEHISVRDLKYSVVKDRVFVVGSTFEDTDMGYDKNGACNVPSITKYNSTLYEEGYVFEFKPLTLDREWGTYVSNNVGILGNLIVSDVELQSDGGLLISSTSNYTEMNDFNPSNSFQQDLNGESDGWVARYIISGKDVEFGKYRFPEIENLTKEESVFLSPNPVNSILNIETNFNVNDIQLVRIIDLKGREVYNNNNKFITSLNLSYLSIGTYYLQIQLIDNFIINKVFVKE